MYNFNKKKIFYKTHTEKMIKISKASITVLLKKIFVPLF